jgi:hypothetical protein
MRTRLNPHGERLLDAGAAVAGVAVMCSIAFVQALHLTDKYQVTHVSGAWMALAKYLDGGTLYPPLFDGRAYGGTRYMPLQIVIDAGAARVTGEYLVSLKLVAFGLLATLLIVLLVILARTFELGMPLPLGCIATLLAANAVSYSAISIGADTLALTLQLVAVALVARSPTPVPIAAAAGLCALAFLTKVTAVWAPIALVLWLAVRDRRRLGVFLPALVVALGLGLAGFGLLSDGRLFANVFGLAGGSLLPFGEAVTEVPHKVHLFLRPGLAVAPLVALAFVGLIAAAFRRTLSVYHFAFAVAIVVVLVVLADRGTAYNQLVDMEALGVLVAAELARRQPGRTAVAAAVLVGLAFGFAVNLRADVADAARAVTGRRHIVYPTNPVAGSVRRSDRLLSEDPYIPVELEELPVVLDAYMFRRIAVKHPTWADDLTRRVQRKRFDKIIVFRHVGEGGALDPTDPYWRTNHFSPSVISAIIRNYQALVERRGYWVYVPRA